MVSLLVIEDDHRATKLVGIPQQSLCACQESRPSCATVGMSFLTLSGHWRQPTESNTIFAVGHLCVRSDGGRERRRPVTRRPPRAAESAPNRAADIAPAFATLPCR